MAEQFEAGYALLIAVDESKEQGWELPDVAKDADALHRVLIHPERCAYVSENVRLVRGKDATRSGILEGLDWLRQKVAADSSGNATAVVYYSGHGLRDIRANPPRVYLRPYDARQASLDRNALRAEDFADELNDLRPQRLLVILDCCHAGAMGAKGAKGELELSTPSPGLFMGGEEVVSPSKGSKGLEALAQGSGRAVLSSSRGGQLSWIRKDEALSIFTYHLIEALTGHAQPQAGAKEVLVSDVMSYVWRHVSESAQADWKKDQQPDYQVSGNFPIALLQGGQGLAKGQPPPALETLADGALTTGDLAIKVKMGNVSESAIAIGPNARAKKNS